MTIIQDYLDLTSKYILEYGTKTLLLMQVGSFFECYATVSRNDTGIGFNCDNYEGSNIQEFSDINDLVIAKKNVSHHGKQVVMAGFGLAQIEKYIRRMQENDYTIVVYTQDSNNSPRGTTRSLSCIYSPGTYFSNDSNELSNVTVCIWIHYSKSNQLINEKLTIGMSSIDIYTGHSNTTEYIIDFIKSPTVFDSLENYLSINNPSECIIISNYNTDYITQLLNCKYHIYNYDNEWIKNISKQKYQHEILKLFFKDPDNIFNEWNISTQSYCFLIQFIYKHNPNLIKKIKIPIQSTTNKLILANHSLKQLNIVPDYKQTGKLSGLSNLLNNCVTNMGKREFNHSLLNPSINHDYLKKIYDITEHTLNNNSWQTIRQYLLNIKDLSKIYRKIILGKLSPKDFYTIYNNLTTVQNIFLYIINDAKLLRFINTENVSFCVTQIQDYITTCLNLENCKKYDDLSFDKFSLMSINDILLFNDTYSPELKEAYTSFQNYYIKLIKIRDFLDLSIKDHELSTKKQKETNDINQARLALEATVRPTGEYVRLHECPKTEPVLIGTTRRLGVLKKIMSSLSCTEFNTKNLEIKTHTGSNSVITSNEINAISRNILKYKDLYLTKLSQAFANFSNHFIDKFELQINTIIDYVIKCDILQNRCYIADNYKYTKPNIVDSNKSFIEFEGLRHPLIEKINTNETYVTNDLTFNDESKGYLLYGTNAVGKTSFIKSIGISIIMAQSGLYVPAETFKFSIYKSIYTRILGNDNIFKGLSSFAVEMTELRNILKYSDPNSLILGDELCSGTESTSALSIFTAGIKYLHNKNSSFIFATHFHEIINYSEIKEIQSLKLLHMSVIYNREQDKLIYDRKLKPGPGENMYGLEVCKSLSLPDDFLELAHQIRNKYSGATNLTLDSKGSKYNALKIKGICEICKENPGSEVHHLVYQKDSDTSNHKKSIKNHKANLINICEECHDKIHQENLQLKIYKTSDGYEIL